MNSIGIIGFGRFGKILANILQKEFRNLLDLVDQICNDTWELYVDLQLYKPYTNDIINKLKLATISFDNRLKEFHNVAN